MAEAPGPVPGLFISSSTCPAARWRPDWNHPNRELRALRAQFLAGQGWGNRETILTAFAEWDTILARCAERDEIVLWFEHDLCDQLQLIRVLAFLAEQRAADGRLSAVIVTEYFAHVPPERFATLLEMRRPVAANQWELGAQAWHAFRSPDPTWLLSLLSGDTSPLPYLAAALTLHLE